MHPRDPCRTMCRHLKMLVVVSRMGPATQGRLTYRYGRHQCSRSECGPRAPWVVQPRCPQWRGPCRLPRRLRPILLSAFVNMKLVCRRVAGMAAMMQLPSSPIVILRNPCIRCSAVPHAKAAGCGVGLGRDWRNCAVERRIWGNEPCR